MIRHQAWILILCVLLGCNSEEQQSLPGMGNTELPNPQASQPSTTQTPPKQPEPTPLQLPKDPQAIKLLAWNLESGGSNPQTIAQQLAQLSGYDVYCLSEVEPSAFEQYRQALPPSFVSIPSQTGDGDRLQILFDGKRFEKLRQKEMTHYQEHTLNPRTHRSPMYVHLRERDSGVEFLVMVNHLARGDARLREEQAVGLREWARDTALPILNLGDFNFDYHYPTEKGNDAFEAMLRDNVWLWVKPKPMVDTNWADRDGDGKDNYPDSMLDFAFVSGAAKDWNPRCRIIVRPGDFPDDGSTSDHRPLELIVTPTAP